MKKKTLRDVLRDLGKRHPALVARDRLDPLIDSLALGYDGALFWAADGKKFPDTRHELAEPLLKVVELLDAEGNRYQLARDAGLDAEGYQKLLEDLDRIRLALPEPPAPRGKGRPAKTIDLREIVEQLADHWTATTKKGFAPTWLKDFPGEPGNDCALFVDAVTRIVTRGEIKQLNEIEHREWVKHLQWVTRDIREKRTRDQRLALNAPKPRI
ncbi:MAG TPA: hypothetical protein VH020_00240 [Stellaceae bacterium]|nr:hypothetical protein [Stellaceae bacterium]